MFSFKKPTEPPFPAPEEPGPTIQAETIEAGEIILVSTSGVRWRMAVTNEGELVMDPVE